MSDTPIFDQVESGDTAEHSEKPVVSKRVRTVAYFTVAIASPLITLISGMFKIWGPEQITANIDATGILLIGTIATIGGIFGVIYRPTKK